MINNIVPFKRPERHEGVDPPEYGMSKLDPERATVVGKTALSMLSKCIEQLAKAGYTEEQLLKEQIASDLCFLHEICVACLLRIEGATHPAHEFMDVVMNEVDKQEDE